MLASHGTLERCSWPIGEHTPVGGHQVVAMVVRRGGDADDRLVEGEATSGSEEGCVGTEGKDPAISRGQPASVPPGAAAMPITGALSVVAFSPVQSEALVPNP
jgi:hypothetical protein